MSEILAAGILESSSAEVLIIVPPFATVSMPMLGPSILASQCMHAGIRTQVLYSNLRLADKIGPHLYEKISMSSFSLMVGELFFRQFAFDDEFGIEDRIESFFCSHEYLAVSGSGSLEISKKDLDLVAGAIEGFLEAEVVRIMRLNPRVVGFSSVFQQNLACVALARLLKRRVPSLVCVLGGPNAASEMGKELFRKVECFTAIFSGEADIEFPRFVAATLKGGETPTAGFVQCTPVQELDAIAKADFNDYFEQVKALSEESKVEISNICGKLLPLETSRGCWWGAKHHCTFCGLNGLEMEYRVKSPKKIMDELGSHVAQYGIKNFQVTDNIMSNQFKREVLPQLASSAFAVEMFFEVKSNLKGSELDDFVRAGVLTIQPGIESLSSAVLARMSKGVTGVQNLWLLRECVSRKIDVVWNLLLDMPGEQGEDYKIHLDLIPLIMHLQPPSGASRVVIDRFSPFHASPASYGITRVTPLDAYKDLYPGFDLSRIAYHFVGDYASTYRSNPDLREELLGSVRDWSQAWTGEGPIPRLYSIALGDGRCFVEDTRPDSQEQRFILEAAESELLLTLCAPHKPIQFVQSEAYHVLIRKRLVVELDGMVMSIVVQPEIGFNLRLAKLKSAGKSSLQTDVGITPTAIQSDHVVESRKVPSMSKKEIRIRSDLKRE